MQISFVFQYALASLFSKKAVGIKGKKTNIFMEGKLCNKLWFL
jgi:hypothetical protein